LSLLIKPPHRLALRRRNFNELSISEADLMRTAGAGEMDRTVGDTVAFA
jgi:hypothetical protein